MKFTLLFLLIHLTAFGQNGEQQLQTAISLQYQHPDSAIAIADRLTLSTTDDTLRSKAYEVIGIAQWVKSEYSLAIAAHSEALKLNKAIGYRSGEAYSLNNLGLNHHGLKDHKTAIKHFLEALALAESLPDTVLMASILGNIGILYEEQGQLDDALAHHQQALNLFNRQPNSKKLANTLNNIALIYKRRKEYEKAENFAIRCLNIRRITHDRPGEAQALNLLGTIASGQGSLTKADSLFKIALNIYTELGDNWGISMVSGNIGADAIVFKEFSKAEKYCLRSLELAKEFKLEWEYSACECLAEVYANKNDMPRATHYWKRLIAMGDSIRNDNTLAEISLQRQRFDNEKEQLLVATRFEKEQALAEAEIDRQRLLGNAAMGIGTMAILLFFVLFRNYRVKQDDNAILEAKNHEISLQKELIQEKNNHITDSIRYAERLQAAILPKSELFHQHFTGHHIIYMPKDIVSGDFFWMEEVDGRIFLAVADCTGHGVPGAMVSMVGFQGLNKAILEERLTSPAAILQRLSNHVEEAFVNSGGTVRDGMDISLCVINPGRRQLTYAGANNSVLIIRSEADVPDGILQASEGGKHLIELKADRRSIGGYFDAGPFTEKNCQLSEGDSIVLYTDGFADQFGGERNRKIGSKRMRSMVFEAVLSGKPQGLESEFTAWKGDNEQIDDVTLITVRI